MNVARKVLEETVSGVAPLIELMTIGGGTTAQIVAAAEQARGAIEELRKVLATDAKPKKPKFSERGYAFADWFRGTLAADVRLSATWRDQWAQCFDEMLKHDERTPEQIAKVCKWARAHDFWKGNFQTPLKLRQRKDGVMYFDRFAEAMKGGGTGSAKRPQSRGYEMDAPKVGRVKGPEDFPDA